MGISLSAIIIVLIYAISVNFALIEFAKFGVGINCPSVSTDYDSTNVSGIGKDAIIDIVLNRCENLPIGLVFVLELPILVGIAYIIRGFIGAT